MHLPARFHLTDLNMYMHDDQHVIGAVVFLHLIYHGAVVDLTRITLAGFNFPLAEAFSNAPVEFRSDLQRRCRLHANEVSGIIEKGLLHGNAAFDEPFCASVAMESAKIQIIYSATAENCPQSAETTRHNLKTNLRLLELLHAGKEGRSPYVSNSRVILDSRLSHCACFSANGG